MQRVLLFVLAVLGSSVAELVNAQSSGSAGMEQLRASVEEFARTARLNNVVRISGVRDHGYGLIIGRQFDRLFVATARHILHEDFVHGEPGPNSIVQVRLYGFAVLWRAVPGEVYQPPRESGVDDLAVIQVLVPRDVQEDGSPYLKADHWREDVIVSDPIPGTAVQLAAMVHDIGYAGGSARIAQVEDGRPVAFHALHAEDGQSGAPVATERGFVALYLGSVERQAIPLLDIKEVVETVFHKPIWMLRPVEARSVSRRLCIQLRSKYKCEVGVSGPWGVVQLDAEMCGSSATGPHRVFCRRMGVECEPSRFNLSESTVGAVVVECKLDPSGMWRSHGQGYLSLQRFGNNSWNATIDLPRQRGRIVGTVTGSPPVLDLEDGVLRGRYPVSGSIRMSEEGLQLDLVSEGQYIDEVFER